MSACSSNGGEASVPDASSAPSVTGQTSAPTTPSTPAIPAIPAAALDDFAGIEGALVIRDDRGNLVITQPDGTDQREIASGEGTRLSQPTLSRAGDRLAWSALDESGSALFVADINGSNKVSSPIASPAFYLSWSLSDSWIATLRPTAASIEFGIADASTAMVQAVGTGQPFYFDWQTTESLIAAVNTTTLIQIQTPGDVAPDIRPIENPLGVFQAPAVLEGDTAENEVEPFERIVVAMLRDGANDVVVLGPDGQEEAIGRASGPIALAVNPVDQRVAVLVVDTQPESQVISFQPDVPPALPAGQVSIIDLETREVVTRVERQIVAMQWSPDGSGLALLQADSDSLQWLIAGSEGVKPLTPFEPSREFATAYLPFADQYNHSSTWWSPDSRAMVMSGSIGGEPGVWVDLVEDDLAAARLSAGDIGLWSER